MSITLREEICTLCNAAKLLPSRREDRAVHVSCLFRWAKTGLWGVRLETICVCMKLCASNQTLERFFARLAEIDATGGEILTRRRDEIARASRDAAEAL